MITRIKRVLYLETGVFEEVEHDETATGQAAIVVIVASILAAIGITSGSFLSSLSQTENPLGFSPSSGSPLITFLGIAVWSILAWLVWSAVTYFIGTKMFHGEATYGEMLRVTGFAYAPLAFMILGGIPCIGLMISFLTIAWTLAAVFIAVKEGLELTINQTVATVFFGWFIYAIGMGILFYIAGLL